MANCVNVVCIFIACSGLIQGIAWLTLSIVSILAYEDIIGWNSLSNIPTSHSETVREYLRILYFTNPSDIAPNFPTRIVAKDNLFGFTLLYLCLSFIWVIVSCFLFFYIKFGKDGKARIVMLIFSIVQAIISVVDIVLMILLIVDYTNIESVQSVYLQPFSQVYSLLAVGIMMSIAARGYVLVVTNIIGVCFGIWYFCKYKNEASQNVSERKQEFVEAYNGDPLKSQWYFPSSYQNEAFELEPTTPQTDTIYRQQNFVRTPSARVNQPSWPMDNAFSFDAPQKNTNVSEYAKPNNKPKPIKVPPPAPPPKPSKKGPPVPFPDYTPPQSPKQLRPVIRQNSSYY